MSLIAPVRNFYGRFERPISSLSLIGGFVFDAITLKRVDMWWENFWILIHLLVVGIFIILIHVQEREKGDERNPDKKHFWYVNILQFAFGGTLSAFLVFYFRSADIFVTWPFMILLALAFIANESLKRHYIKFSFQISLFFLSVYSFAIFLVPVVLHRIGVWIFLLSGILSLIFINTFIKTLFYFIKETPAKKHGRKRTANIIILIIFAIVNFLYFTNLIPPIPLSLKDAGVFHSIEKDPNGNYYVAYEDHGWREYFTFYPEFTLVPGSPVYAYSAIFSPKGLNLHIAHEWQRYDESQKKWIDGKAIPLSVVGGRDDGFRTYSVRSNLTPGKWRVNIETEQGQLIGRLRFNLVSSDTEPILTIKEK